MSTRQVSNRNDPVIESRDQLVEPMAKGEKPREAWRIGTEHEKFVYRTKDRAAPSYSEPGGIRDLLLAAGLWLDDDRGRQRHRPQRDRHGRAGRRGEP